MRDSDFWRAVLTRGVLSPSVVAGLVLAAPALWDWVKPWLHAVTG